MGFRKLYLWFLAEPTQISEKPCWPQLLQAYGQFKTSENMTHTLSFWFNKPTCIVLLLHGKMNWNKINKGWLHSLGTGLQKKVAHPFLFDLHTLLLNGNLLLLPGGQEHALLLLPSLQSAAQQLLVWGRGAAEGKEWWADRFVYLCA